MINICKIHKSITLIQVVIIIVSCLVSSLGIVITHSVIIYAWYLALVGIVTVIVTSTTLGIVLILTRLIYVCRSRKLSKSDCGWFVWPEPNLVCGIDSIMRSR